MNKEISNSTKIMLCGIAVALNIVLGMTVSMLKLPFYLDTIGTIFIAIYFGPWYGAAVGGTTNFLSSILINIAGMPFMLVSISIGLVVGFLFRKISFNFRNAFLVGILLSIVAPLIGTPIGVAVYGGLTGTISDVAVFWLKQSGANIFTASFLPKIANNLIDKIGTCLLVYFIVAALPWELKPKCYRKSKDETKNKELENIIG